MPEIFLLDWSLFFGRFHPVVVHLPIGMLLLAAILEWWPGDRLQVAARIAWGLGALTALFSVVFGWLLASSGDYGGDALFWHRWLGVGVMVAAALGLYFSRKRGSGGRWYAAFVAALLLFTGHQGGNLTHGETYLWEHAPGLVQNLVGFEGGSQDTLDFSQTDIDSIDLYTTFLQPIIEKKCVRCHNADKQNGGYRMDTPAHLLGEGDNGPMILAGNSTASELVRRITLPRKHSKAMPPQGQAMDYTEVALMRYWVDQGADTAAMLRPAEVPQEIKWLLERDYGLELRAKSFVERLRLPPLTSEVIRALEAGVWRLDAVAATNPAQMAAVRAGQTVDATALQTLAAQLSEHLVELDLNRQPLADEDLGVLNEFTNLHHLRLNNTQLTDAGLDPLLDLPNLATLNIYGTAITDDGLAKLAAAPALKRLYLWGTSTSDEGIAVLQAARPELEIIGGFQFAAPSK
ncbi:MAG: c-type cytochrome domain-containing protein [Bacteroidota bacterium]